MRVVFSVECIIIHFYLNVKYIISYQILLFLMTDIIDNNIIDVKYS